MKKLIDHVDHHHEAITTSPLVATAETAVPADPEAPVAAVIEAEVTPNQVTVFFGTDGDDFIVGTAGDDAIFGFFGFDQLNGGDGNDSLYGGSDTDVDVLIGGSGNDMLDGGGGSDFLLGGDGFDTVSYADAPVGVTVNLGDANQCTGDAFGDRYGDIEAISLSFFDDIFQGSNAVFPGAHNNDIVFGDFGNDILSGGAGDDQLHGDDGDDQLDGGDGNDTLIGGAGDDFITGGGGADLIDGGAGFDTVNYADGSPGSDRPVVVNLVDPTQNAGNAAGDVFVNVEAFQLSGFTDVFVGSDGNDTVDGLTGDDIISGGAGDDTLFGGRGHHGGHGSATGGNDTLLGGDGNDTLSGQNGNDFLDGGVGDDTLDGGAGLDIISGGVGNDTIVIHASEVPFGEIIDGGDGIDRLVVGDNNMHPHATISNMEELFLNSGVQNVFLTSEQLADFDTITHQDGSGAAFSITAQNAGPYSLAGKTITGILSLNGSSGDDTLIGSSGDDILSGKGGADVIQAGDGNDTILIGTGEAAPGESIDGGAGFDRLLVSDPNADLSAVTITGIEEIVLGSGVSAIALSSAQLADVEHITQADGAAFTINAASAGVYSLAGMTITGIATLSGSSGAD